MLRSGVGGMRDAIRLPAATPYAAVATAVAATNPENTVPPGIPRIKGARGTNGESPIAAICKFRPLRIPRKTLSTAVWTRTPTTTATLKPRYSRTKPAISFATPPSGNGNPRIVRVTIPPAINAGRNTLAATIRFQTAILTIDLAMTLIFAPGEILRRALADPIVPGICLWVCEKTTGATCQLEGWVLVSGTDEAHSPRAWD